MSEMKCITNGRILLPDNEVHGCALLFGKKIRGIVSESEIPQDAEIIDAQQHYVAPGFIDVHIHGYLGADVSDGSKEGIVKMARALPQNGVTAFLPTTMTESWPLLERVFGQIRELMHESTQEDFAGAEVLGCHVEGPFINPAKKGAQALEYILKPEIERVLPWKDVMRLLTLAPECDEALQFVQAALRDTDIKLSIGHTVSSFEQAKAAFDAGVDHATHLFNAMTGLNHREPGTVGAALTDDRVYTELIADTFHVHPGVFPLVRRMKGDKLVLITDCTRAGGMPDGEYTLGGQTFTLKGIQCRLPDGTIAGSVLKLNEAVRNWRQHTGCTMAEAVRAASLSPAQSIGADRCKGSLETGKDADIVLMDAECAVRNVFVRGRKIIG